MINIELIHFLIDNSIDLVREPIGGQLKDIFLVFSHNDQFNNRLAVEFTFREFLGQLNEIIEMSPGSITFKKEFALSPMNDSIEFIDVFLLTILYNKLIDKSTEDSLSTKPNDKNVETSLQDRVLDLIDFEGSACTNYYEDQLSHVLYNKYEQLMGQEPVSYTLARQRAKQVSVMTEYIEVCRDPNHATYLSSSCHINNNKIVSLHWSKLNKYENDSPGFLDCLRTHIHYVPNIKSQTDLSLGDCSYLDTCHKLNSCRYLHYLQYVPEVLKRKVEQHTIQHNESSKEYVPFYTHGQCCSTVVKDVLPPQWIRCDVRKFDFSVLGKFSVVIADPAWNIHMNLPYGTCNDIELLELPLDQLQDEGVLFLWVTGRAIELGKESLTNWGYKVINEISWIKTNQLGRTIVTGRTGHWLNHSKEHLLVGIKGKPAWINKHIDIDLIVAATRETSRKPDELYGIAERLVGKHARKLEIFGRDHNVRPGWFTIGNQLSGTCIHELDVKRKHESRLRHQMNNRTKAIH